MAAGGESLCRSASWKMTFGPEFQACVGAWLVSVVFVEARQSIALSWDAASRGLKNALGDGGLVGESRRAVSDGLEYVMPVGPRGGDRLEAHDVQVQVVSIDGHDRMTVVALRWSPTGSGRFLPSLDGNLTLAIEGPEESSLSIVAVYRPPLGILGTLIDSAVMSRVATATMNALLREIAEQIEELADN